MCVDKYLCCIVKSLILQKREYQEDSGVGSLYVQNIYPVCTSVIKFSKCFPVIINLFTDNVVSIIPRDLVGHTPFLFLPLCTYLVL